MTRLSRIFGAVAALLGAAAMPAHAADFPAQGKPITLIVPFSAGGSTDVGARALAAGLEKELGVPFQVINRPGAGSQVAITELVRAKPDGYTIGYTVLPHTVTIYLDPDRQAIFNRQSLQFVAMHVSDPQLLTVRADSPYQTTRDLVEAAKAGPGKIKGAAVGILGPEHLGILQLEQMAGVQFAKVQFDGGAPAMAAVLGGHVDFYMGTLGVFTSAAKAGKVRFLGVMDKVPTPYAPEVTTLASQGYALESHITRVLSVPAGTPKPVVDRLASAIQKVTASDEHKGRIEQLGMTMRFMGPAETTAYWDQVEATIRPLMAFGKQ